MNLSRNLFEASPLIVTFGSAIVSGFYKKDRAWHNFVLALLAIVGIFFISLFLYPERFSTLGNNSFFQFGFDQFSLFVAGLFCLSLFMGIFPLRMQINLSPAFLYYFAGGLGIILSGNLVTFFIFWTFQRSIPFFKFIKDYREGSGGVGGTFILQYLFTFICLTTLLVIAFQNGYATSPMSEIPAGFFSWTVLSLSLVITFESHGIFPFHSWVHDVVERLPWYEISCLFLSRAGVVLFVKFILPTHDQDPNVYKFLFLALTIFSSLYWSFRGIFESNVAKTTTYFYIAQASLILTGLQANIAASRGAYLNMMVISLSGTAMWSLLNYVQHYFSFKRLNRFYGLSQYFPRLTVLFCLFGFCMIGVPLGASFVVEDLVITGLLEQQPYLGLGHIGATCLNGILFFMLFTKIFLGHSAFKQPVKNLDMSLPQMVPYVVVLIVMFLMGILPYLFLEKLQW